MRGYKIFKALLLALAVMLVTMSCERRELIEVDTDNVKVNVHVDWSRFNCDKPDKMTVVFFPKDGGKPIWVVTDNVDDVTVELPSGSYDILVFNDEVTDFDSYEFTDVDSLGGFGIKILDGKDPEPFGTDNVDVVVPNKDVTIGSDGNIIVSDVTVNAPTLYPVNILWTGTVVANISGIEFVRDLNATFSGLASTYTLAGPQGPTVSANLVDWTKSGSTKMTSTFYCLGLPLGWVDKAESNLLTMNFDLTNEKSVVREIPVGDIMQIDNDARTLFVEIGTVVSQTEGGYDIDVEPWDFEITVK